jgi:hypothetical protein
MQAMAVPIKPDKLDTWLAWCADLKGSRKQEFDAMNERLGLTTHASWHQPTPDGHHFAIVVVDGPGEADFLGKIATSENEFESWFRTVIEDVHPMDFSNPPPLPTREL